MIRKKTAQYGQAGEISSPVNLATLYSARSQHAIDGSNRIMLPSEWRGEGTPMRFFVIVADSDKYLVVCPPPVFENFLAELRDETADKTQIPHLERELNDRVQQVCLDRFGRLPLPADFLARAGIEKQGDLVGRFSKFEIWPCPKNQAAQAERKQTSAALSKKLQCL
jgi:division/cell wall cluster transcriptional repressor MraZ